MYIKNRNETINLNDVRSTVAKILTLSYNPVPDNFGPFINEMTDILKRFFDESGNTRRTNLEELRVLLTYVFGKCEILSHWNINVRVLASEIANSVFQKF
jgi:hypothetical protein